MAKFFRGVDNTYHPTDLSQEQCSLLNSFVVLILCGIMCTYIQYYVMVYLP